MEAEPTRRSKRLKKRAQKGITRWKNENEKQFFHIFITLIYYNNFFQKAVERIRLTLLLSDVKRMSDRLKLITLGKRFRSHQIQKITTEVNDTKKRVDTLLLAAGICPKIVQPRDRPNEQPTNENCSGCGHTIPESGECCCNR